MKRWGEILSRIFIGLVFLGAGALVLFSLAHLPPQAADPVPLRTDRPVDVGDALGEAFLRKIERPDPVALSGLIRVQDESFSAAYDELYDHRDRYYGREIELGGYVLCQRDLEAGSFLVGRDLLWCCANDMYFIGFLVFWPGPRPAEGATVVVRGVLEPVDYHNPETGKTFKVPGIRATYVGPLEGVPRVVYPY